MSTDSKFSPYAAPENVVRVLERVRKGGVKRLDEDFLISIGINEGMINRTLRALEFLGFRNPDGTATNLLDRYKVLGDEDARALLLEAIRTAYEPIFHAVDPTTDDRRKVEVAFRGREPSGQWGRMVTLFLGLCSEAGMSVLDTPSKRPGGRDLKPPRTPRVRAVRPTASMTEGLTPPPATLHVVAKVDPALQGLIAKFGDLKTIEDLERWYATLKTVFQFVHNV